VSSRAISIRYGEFERTVQVSLCPDLPIQVTPEVTPEIQLLLINQLNNSCNISTRARLFDPGGVPSLLAESLLLKHQFLVLSRSQKRSPNLSSTNEGRIGGDGPAARSAAPRPMKDEASNQFNFLAAVIMPS
jgi:hypothetical protein